MNKKIFSIALCVIMLFGIFAMQAEGSIPAVVVRSTAYGSWTDTNLTFEERAADLVSRMTVAQKATTSTTASGNDYVKTPAIPALNIKATNMWSEALHGIARQGIATSFPTALSMVATWNEDLMLDMMTVAGSEARAKDWQTGRGLMYFSPTINLARDPRWGRGDESYGEDPFLTSKIGTAFVKGFQGDNPDDPYYNDRYQKAIATVKHFACNNNEGTRTSISVAVDDRDLREYYVGTFQNIVEDAQPGSIMTTYNGINGQSNIVNTYLIDRLLRKTWGFEGYVVTDCAAYSNVNNQGGFNGTGWSSPDGLWKSTGNLISQSGGNVAMGLTAGNDAECGSTVRAATVTSAISNANLPFFTEDVLNRAIYRILNQRMKLGEFDPAEMNSYSKITADILEAPESLALSLEASRQAPVLIKNNDKILPVDISKVKSIVVLGALANYVELGDYSGAPIEKINFKQGLTTLLEEKGYTGSLEFFNGMNFGTTSSAAMYKNDQAEAMAAAKEADLVIAYVGTDRGTFDHASLFGTASENSDRAAALTLPGNQGEMISAIDNENIVVVMTGCGFFDVNSFTNKTKGIVYTAYNGPYTGTAMAELLTGKANFSGRLPFTWYKSITDVNTGLPAITNYYLRKGANSTTGRTYQYYEGAVDYPFGYGLSYSNFEVGDFNISKSSASADEKIEVTCKVTNNGEKGAEVVQVYMVSPMRLSGDNQYPKKQLKGFARVELNKGESKQVTIELDTNDFFFIDSTGKPDRVTSSGDIVNDAGKRVVYGGTYEIQVAKSAADSDILKKFDLAVAVQTAPKIKNVTLVDDKVVAHVGETFNARTVVVMTDEQYLTDGSAAITYTSSRPAVATIDPNTGAVTPLAPGTTILTAKVVKDGVTVEDTVPLAVQLKESLSLSDITLDGVRLPSFNFSGENPATRHVVELEDKDNKPVVAATAPSGTTVTVTQAGTGNTAQIAVSDASGDSALYTIEFVQAAPEVSEVTTEYAEKWTPTGQPSAFSGAKMKNISIVTGEDAVVPFKVTTKFAEGASLTVKLLGTDGKVYDSVVEDCGRSGSVISGALKITGKVPVDNLTIEASIGGTTAKKAAVVPARKFDDVASIIFNPNVTGTTTTTITWMTGLVSTSSEQWGPGVMDTGIDLSGVTAYVDTGSGFNPVTISSRGGIHSTTMGRLVLSTNPHNAKEIKLTGVKFVRILPDYEFTIIIRPKTL